MKHCERLLRDIDIVLFAYGAKRAPYKTPEAAAWEIVNLCRLTCENCIHDPESIECSISSCEEGKKKWLEAEV